jgi:hypothetical protein
MHQHEIIAPCGFARSIFALVNPSRRIYALSGIFFEISAGSCGDPRIPCIVLATWWKEFPG